MINLEDFATSTAEFESGGLYGSFYTMVSEYGYLQTSKDLWEIFTENILPEIAEATDFANDDHVDLSKPFTSKKYNMDRFAISLFKETLRTFFTEWLPYSTTAPRNVFQMKDKFQIFVRDSSRSQTTKRSSAVFFWAWYLLLKHLRQSQNTAINKANAALLFGFGEKAAVEKMSKVEFVQQTSSSDFETIKKNMDAQQIAENNRNWRSIIGKHTAEYQNGVQISNDIMSQYSQMATKMIQEVESIVSTITRIG